MKRMRIWSVLAICLFSSTVRAADTPQFVLRPDGTVEQRVAKVESEVERLSARIADLERQLGNVAAKPKAEAAPARVRYSVCVGGRCTIYEVDAGTPIPLGATVLNAALPTASEAAHVKGSPCPTGGCGDACSCVGVSSSSGGWYLFKNLGRRR